MRSAKKNQNFEFCESILKINDMKKKISDKELKGILTGNYPVNEPQKIDFVDDYLPSTKSEESAVEESSAEKIELSNIPVEKKKPIESLVHLLDKEDREALKRAFDIKQMFNANPPRAWLKKHKIIANYFYLPIDKVELLLDTMTLNWECEIISYNLIANSICVQCRLKVTHLDGSVRVMDGIGAAPIQVNAGASPIDQTQMKSNAIMIGLPAAYGYALKNAAKRLGKIFGRDVEREDPSDFNIPETIQNL